MAAEEEEFEPWVGSPEDALRAADQAWDALVEIASAPLTTNDPLVGYATAALVAELRAWRVSFGPMLDAIPEGEGEHLCWRAWDVLGCDHAAVDWRERYVDAEAAADLARVTDALREIAEREWRDEGGRIAAAIARDGLNATGRFDPELDRLAERLGRDGTLMSGWEVRERFVPLDGDRADDGGAAVSLAAFPRGSR